MRGDFVLFHYAPHSWQHKLISMITKGPFIHAEIDLGDAWIGMLSHGMRKHAPEGASLHTVTVPVTSHFGQEGIETGLSWVEGMWQGAKASNEVHEYGWADIVSDALKALGITFFTFGRPGAWDCSDFVTRYLLEAGAAGPLGELANDPGTVSPNDLARAFKVPMV